MAVELNDDLLCNIPRIKLHVFKQIPKVCGYKGVFLYR